VLLGTAGDLGELGLRDAGHEPLQTAKGLGHTLRIHDIVLRLADERLDLGHRVTNQMPAKPLIHLLQHQLQELLLLVRLGVEDLVHEPALDQLLGRDALAHDERLVGFRDAHALDEAAAGAALGDEAEGGEGGQDEGVRGGVDEVGEADEGGGEAYGGAVEGCDEDLGVRVEGLGGVDVVGDEGGEPLLVEVAAFVFATDGDVGAAGRVLVNNSLFNCFVFFFVRGNGDG
jgi:hypothetical protein